MEADKAAGPLGSASSEGLGHAETLHGFFGSLWANTLVFRVPDGPWYYLLIVDNSDLQWGLYCNDAIVTPADKGVVTEVRCLGKTFHFPCWRLDRRDYVGESMRITAMLAARPNVRAKPTTEAADGT